MREVAGLIAEVLENPADETTLASVRRRVSGLTERFPLYAWKMASAAAH
jgi:glycine/serine hydroxymethyltransferase